MAILVQFEKVNSLTGKDVQEALQLNTDQFSKNVACLVASNLLKSNTQVISCFIHIYTYLQLYIGIYNFLFLFIH